MTYPWLYVISCCLQVQEGDGLPNLMCVQCVLQCSRAYTFKQQCEKSENILRQYMSPEFQAQLNQVLNEQQAKTELEEQLQFSENITNVIIEEELPADYVHVSYTDPDGNVSTCST